MEKQFLQVFDLSVIGAAAIVLVVVVRLLLSRLPKRYAYILWLAPAYLLTGLNLFQSRRSFGLRQTAGQQITGVTFTGVPDSLFQAVEASVPGLAPTPYASANPLQLLVWLLANLWVVGMVVLVAYSLWSVLQLQLRLRGAERLEGNVYLCRTIKTPFVLGLLRPRIYLPAGLGDAERDYILQHERTHIRRGDHLVKPLAFLLLAVHWFNPFCWLGFYLFSRDMEMSCDEAVVRKLGSQIKQPYAGSLLALAAPRTIFAGSPLAFGEGHTGRRIKNLLDYKKPALWATVVVVILLGWLMWGLVADLPPEEQGWLGQLYANRTEHIGNNSKLSQIADRLDMPEGLTPDGGIELETSGTRNRAEFFYLDSSPDGPNLTEQEQNELQRNAIMAFALVENMDAITFSLHAPDTEGGTVGYTATREQATRTLGNVDPWERSGTLAEFERLYNELNERVEKGTLVMGREPESVVPGETVAEPVAVTGNTSHPTESGEAPSFFSMASVGLQDAKAVATAFAKNYLSYYTNGATSKSWQGYTITNVPWTSGTEDNSDLMMAVQYDLELRNDPQSDPTQWPTTSVGEGYRMIAEVALEGEDLTAVVTSTRFEKIA